MVFCPNCHSPGCRISRRVTWVRRLARLLFVRRFGCPACGTRFWRVSLRRRR